MHTNCFHGSAPGFSRDAILPLNGQSNLHHCGRNRGSPQVLRGGGSPTGVDLLEQHGFAVVSQLRGANDRSLRRTSCISRERHWRNCCETRECARKITEKSARTFIAGSIPAVASESRKSRDPDTARQRCIRPSS